ncbi:E3 ubiquitin-protein ligase XIAP-like [Frankliniella occidentalis]|uniref:E3 ubiquitin-protein ligase XIAP-like n=1 Tax=Frankliniella occidentalis TaxID=133901 RepID=A0A9C6X908_FRAOC|nr:E3 ubiquitin-protein ligase XIAP-like [Frankliniella occidentalis]
MATARRLGPISVWRRGLYSEARRLSTFHNFGPASMSPAILAANGFFHEFNNRLRCFSCSLQLLGVGSESDIFALHLKWSPFCEFLRGLPVNNIPIQGSSLKDSDVGPGFRWVDGVPASSLDTLGVVEKLYPLYPKYALYESRMKTFDSWPVGLALKPCDLARAGWFYSGNGDVLLCHHCGGKVEKLHAKIAVCDLWKMHAKAVPTCEFVLVHKGILFVRAASKWSETCAEENKAEPDPTFFSTPSSVEIKCKVCFVNNCCFAILPCNHYAICWECNVDLRNCGFVQLEHLAWSDLTAVQRGLAVSCPRRWKTVANDQRIERLTELLNRDGIVPLAFLKQASWVNQGALNHGMQADQDSGSDTSSSSDSDSDSS